VLDVPDELRKALDPIRWSALIEKLQRSLRCVWIIEKRRHEHRLAATPSE